ncbi:MAG: hypothetical protein ACXWKG_14955 [Limisphaerales bacterium]
MGLLPCTLFTRLSAVFLTVALLLCAVESRATKIEFSVATSDIEVPDLQKELKQDAKSALKSEVDFKGAVNVPQMAAPIMVSPSENRERDPFSMQEKDRDKDKNRFGRNFQSAPSDDADIAKRNAMIAEQMKAAKPPEQVRNEDSLSGSSWQVNRRAFEGDSDSISSSREKSIGWSTLFKEAQEERDRRQQTARLNDFRALYDTPNSIAPIGTPPPNSDPVKDSLWHEPGINSHDGRTELMSRRDDPQYNQQLPGSRGSGDTFDPGPARSDSRGNQIAPVRQFEQHRGVLEMPQRPGDLLNR